MNHENFAISTDPTHQNEQTKISHTCFPNFDLNTWPKIIKLNGIYYSVFLFWLQTQRREKFDYAVTIFAYGFLLLHLTPSCHKWAAAQLGCKVSVLGLQD